MEHQLLYLFLACGFGLFMTWGVGANDLANVMSTTMGSKAVSVRTAVIIAVVFEIAGAFLGGSAVSDTLRHEIINLDYIAQHHEPLLLIEGMLAVLMAGMTWMGLASFLGFPVSITNAIVGSIVGFGVVVVGMDGVHWQEVSLIALSWISSPVVAGIVAFILFRSIQVLMLSKRDPLANAIKYLPYYFFLVGMVLSYITVFKALQHLGIDYGKRIDLLICSLVGLLTVFLGKLATRQFIPETRLRRRDAFIQIENMFAVLMGLTACAMVFAHGANDVSVAVGPITVVFSMVMHGDLATLSTGFPAWITLLGVVGVLTGLITYGKKVIETVGSRITALTPSRAFAATISAATAVVISTSIGLPVSTTQTLVGSVLGVGLARGIGALNTSVIRNIFMSWVITLPAASLLTIVFFNILKRWL